MREIHEDQDNHIKEEFAKFINLLQSDSHNNNLGGQEDNSQMLSRTLTKKLSIILSASEP
jgi:16S rRNA G527 N7-methylase RsmG